METQRRGREGIQLAIDLSQGSAPTWVAGEPAVALADLGAEVFAAVVLPGDLTGGGSGMTAPAPHRGLGNMGEMRKQSCRLSQPIFTPPAPVWDNR